MYYIYTHIHIYTYTRVHVYTCTHMGSALLLCSVCVKPPYEVKETGWGEFEIQIKIYFQDSSEKPVKSPEVFTFSYNEL